MTRTDPRTPWRTRRPHPRAAVGSAALALALTLTLTGCGNASPNAGSAGPGSAGPGNAGAGNAGAGNAGARNAGFPVDPADADPRALGIDTATWPTEMDAAQQLFDAMPDQLAGLSVKRGGWASGSAGIVYGPNNTGVSAFVMAPEGELGGPKDTLSAMFGMGMVCAIDTYAGTAELTKWGKRYGIPGSGGPGDDPWWFTCSFEAGESTTYTGHALGWVSRDLAWLVTTPDEATTGRIADAMIAATETS